MRRGRWVAFSGINLAVLLMAAWMFGTAQPAFSAATIQLRLASNTPEAAALNTFFFKKWGSDVEKVTGGRVKITYYFNQSLLKQADMYDGTIKGVADVVWAQGAYYPNRFPLSTVIELPSGLTSGEVGSKILWELYDKYLKNEYRETKVLEVSASSPKYLFFSTKAIKKMEDMKGARVHATGRTEPKIVRLLGGSPQVVPFPEVYSALERGIVDGGLLSSGGIPALRLQEILKYFNDYPFTLQPNFMVMNKAKWESLPPDIQKQIESVSGSYASQLHGAAWDTEEKQALKLLADKGVLPYHMPPDETKRWKEVIAPLTKEWVDEMEGKGLPGKKVHDDFIKLVEKYSTK